MGVCYSVIGTIHTDLRDREAIPIQGVYSGVEGSIEILPEFREGLKDLEGFSHPPTSSSSTTSTRLVLHDSASARS